MRKKGQTVIEKLKKYLKQKEIYHKIKEISKNLNIGKSNKINKNGTVRLRKYRNNVQMQLNYSNMNYQL
jgi:hypothetical protein